MAVDRKPIVFDAANRASEHLANEFLNHGLGSLGPVKDHGDITAGVNLDSAQNGLYHRMRLTSGTSFVFSNSLPLANGAGWIVVDNITGAAVTPTWPGHFEFGAAGAPTIANATVCTIWTAYDYEGGVFRCTHNANAPGGGGGGISPPASPTKGDVLVYDGSAWNKHTHGADGQLIQFDSSTSNGLRNIATPFAPFKSLAEEILADSPTSYYKCNEQSGSTITDYGSAGINLTIGASSSLATAPLYPLDDTTYFTPFYTLSSSAPGANGTGNPAGVSTYSGDWTFEAVLNISRANTAYNGVFCVKGAASSQFQAIIYVHNGFLKTYWSRSGGTMEVNPSATYLTYPGTFHVAIVKDSAAKTVAFYFNGVLAQSPITYANECNAVHSSSTVHVGSDGVGTPYLQYSQLGHLAFYYGQKLSVARIIAHAKAAGKFCP